MKIGIRNATLLTVSDNNCLRYEILLFDTVVFKRHQRYQYVSRARSQSWCIQQRLDFLDGSRSKVSTIHGILGCLVYSRAVVVRFCC